MDSFDLDLRDRLVRLEAAAPAASPPALGTKRGFRSRLSGVALGVVAVILAAGAVAGGVAVLGEATGHEGLFNPGQPLYCSGVERMTPPVAAGWLAERGYTVTWQIEDRDGLGSKTGSSVQSAVPPTDGYIIEGILEGRHMTLVVETGAAARPANIAPCR